MPAQADRQLRIALDQLEKLGHRVDDLEDTVADQETRLKRAGFPRDMRPAAERRQAQADADQMVRDFQALPGERHDITAPGYPDDAA